MDTDSTLFGYSCNESPEKKGYDRDSDYEPEKQVNSNLKKRKSEPEVKWNGKRFKKIYALKLQVG